MTITQNFQAAATTMRKLQGGLRTAKKERDSAHKQVESMAKDISDLSVERDALKSHLAQR